MHPNPLFRSDDRALLETLIDEIGFGMIFRTTPDGPRVAHTPLVLAPGGAVRFHLARGNALARHLAGHDALALLNGPDAYVSPRWYAQTGQVPTWNYVALELEGPVRKLEREETVALLAAIAAANERHVPGPEWTLDQVAPGDFDKLLGGIVGFELEVRGWRPTLKLSQNKSAAERAGIADALEAAGSPALAQLMRTLAA